MVPVVWGENQRQTAFRGQRDPAGQDGERPGGSVEIAPSGLRGNHRASRHLQPWEGVMLVKLQL